MHDCLPTKYPMNATNTTSGGWAMTKLRTETIPGLVADVPSDLANHIVTAKKTSFNGSSGDITTYDKWWIPSGREVGLTDSNNNQEKSGIIYSGLYKSNANRIKMVGGTASGWWLRGVSTVSSVFGSDFRGVDTTGASAYNYASASHGIPISFCLGTPAQAQSSVVPIIDPAILAAIDDGTYSSKYHVGDTVTVDLGGTLGLVDFDIAGIDADVDINGNTIPLSFISHNLLPNKYQMNSTDTTTGGWASTLFRNTTLPNLVSGVSSTLTNRIVWAKKTSFTGSNGDQTTYDRWWIPSGREVGLTDSNNNQEQSGPVYSGLFHNNAARVKTCNGTASTWWLRGVSTNSSNFGSTFRYVNTSGASSNVSASASYGIPLGFSLGSLSQAADSEPVDYGIDKDLLKSIDDGTYSSKYHVGDEFSVNLGGSTGTHTFVIAGIDVDEDENGKKLPVTMIMKNCLPTKYPMNVSNTTSGGWNATKMRTTTIPSLVANVPSGLNKYLGTAKKISFTGNSGDQTTYDKWWIPSGREVGLTNSNNNQEKSGPIYSTLFPSDASRVKTVNGSASNWWLRGVSTNSSVFGSAFGNVSTSGSSSNNYASYSYGVCLGFTLQART